MDIRTSMAVNIEIVYTSQRACRNSGGAGVHSDDNVTALKIADASPKAEEAKSVSGGTVALLSKEQRKKTKTSLYIHFQSLVDIQWSSP